MPCPFCGYLPMVGPTDPKREGDAWGFVQCINTQCDATPRVEAYTDDGAPKEQAIARWNLRAPTGGE